MKKTVFIFASLCVLLVLTACTGDIPLPTNDSAINGNATNEPSPISTFPEDYEYIEPDDIYLSSSSYDNASPCESTIVPIESRLELEDIPEQIPSIYANISENGLDTQRIRVASGSASWSYLEASGDHPLDFWEESWDCIDFNAFRASLEHTESEVEISFTSDFPPTSLTVRRWNTEFIGMSPEMWNNYEHVEITDNTIRIHNDGNDYIYQLEARWIHGDTQIGWASLTFRLDGAG